MIIKYNLRFRGPYEYDKYVLTAMQFHNETKRLMKTVKSGADALLSKDSGINRIYEAATAPDSTSTQILNLRYGME